jgi:chromosome segregation ATPase
LPSLYELTDMYDTVMNMLYDEDVDQQAILDTLEGIEMEFEDKADNYAKIIKNINSDIEAIKLEMDRLQARKQSLENKSRWLKDTLEANMKQIGKTKFKTALFSFNIQKNGGLQPLVIDEVDINKLPKEYLIPQDPLPDKDKIRRLLETQQVPWAHLEPRGESLRIR